MALTFAFLRAINVGRRRIKMQRLREVFEELGLKQVETLIASGNVIFEDTGEPAAALERRIEAHLEEALGYEVATFLRTRTDLAAITAFDGIPPVEGRTLRVGFLHRVHPADALSALVSPTDPIVIFGRELFWQCASFHTSKVSGAAIERQLGRQPTTLRNVQTVARLLEAYP